MRDAKTGLECKEIIQSGPFGPEGIVRVEGIAVLLSVSLNRFPRRLLYKYCLTLSAIDLPHQRHEHANPMRQMGAGDRPGSPPQQICHRVDFHKKPWCNYIQNYNIERSIEVSKIDGASSDDFSRLLSADVVVVGSRFE
jgi:hypothetical protein